MADPELARSLAELGVRSGSVLLVHASLRGSGLRDVELLQTLRTLLGPEGTLVVPAFTPENSDTSLTHSAATAGMTQREVADYRAAMLPFERDSTPCPTMGVFAECVRTAPGAVRSGHPQSSFAALGQRAAELLGDHDPHCHLGERSPLAALYGAHADVLLFRVGFQVCSAFHLAQYRRNGPASLRTYRCVVERKGNWVSYEDVAMDDSDFPAIGAALPRRLVAEGQVADKPVRLFGMRGGVDHAKAYMAEYQS